MQLLRTKLIFDFEKTLGFCHVLETFSSVTFADVKNQTFSDRDPGKIVEIFLEVIFRIEIDENKMSFQNFRFLYLR